jgi:hypothetical protein
VGSIPAMRCALCLRGLNEWYYGRVAPLCVWCSDKLGPVCEPRHWEIQPGRASDAARRAWEYWARPRQPYDEDEPLTHFFHCWRFPDHHRCAVALIEQQARENDQMLVRAAMAERALREQQREARA